MPKYIKKLTAKQEALLPLYVKKWTENGHRTDPLDPAKAIKDVEWVYENILKKDKPKVFFVESPIQATLLGAMLFELGTLENSERQNLGQNLDQNLRQNLRQNLIQNLWQNLEQNLSQNLIQNLWQNLGQNLRQNLRQNLGQNLDQNLRQNLIQNLWQNLGQNLRQNLSQNLGQNLRQNLRQNLGQNIEQNLEQNLSQNLIQNLWQNLGQNLEQNLGQNLEQNLDQNLEQNLWQNLDQNLSQNLGQNLIQNLSQNLIQNLWQNLGQNLDQNLSQNLEQNLWQNLEQNLEQNLGQNLEQNLWQNLIQNLWQNLRQNLGQNQNRWIQSHWNDWYSVNWWVSWIGYYEFILNELFPEEKETHQLFTDFIEHWKDLHLIYPYEGICFVVNRPAEIHTNSTKQLHRDLEGPALLYRDGYCLWALNNIQVPQNIVLTPADKLEASLVLKEKNAEIRREIVRKIGTEKLCTDLKAESVDKFEGYELLLLDLQDGRKRPYLKMTNPSIGVVHIEGVHPDCKNVQEALAWRNGQITYKKPEILT